MRVWRGGEGVIALVAMVAASCFAGCAGGPPPAPVSIGGPRLVEGELFGAEPGLRHRLTLDLRFETERRYNARIGMDLSLASWVDGEGARAGQRFVVLAQREPSFRQFTYREGMFSAKHRCVVTELVERRDEATPFTDAANQDAARARRRGQAVLDAWSREYADVVGDVVGGGRWSLEPEIAWRVAPLRGRFAWIVAGGAPRLDGGGRLRADGLLDRVDAPVYRWHEPGKEDPTDDPRFFEMLAAALAAYAPSPLPPGGVAGGLAPGLAPGLQWVARCEWATTALVRAARHVNPTVRRRLDPETRATFEVPFRCEALEGDVARIEAGCAPDVAIGDTGYRLARYTRVVRYDQVAGALLADRVHLEGRSGEGDRFELELALELAPTGGDAEPRALTHHQSTYRR